MGHTGIRTMVDGVVYRSRTEALWAVAFKQWGWPAHYEALELDGYLPDFVVAFPAGDLLVEIKGPVEDIEAAKIKIDCSQWGREALIMALPDRDVVGVIREASGEWGEARLFRCLSCGSVSVHTWDRSWHCRVCGASEGNSHVGEFDPFPDLAESANRVQWRRSA